LVLGELADSDVILLGVDYVIVHTCRIQSD
jgi:hypothetical protein